MTTINNRLDEIATALKDGADPAEFQAELDQLLETSMEERNPEAEGAWEDSYRNGGVE